ncbi:hypothetical protein [Streptomyces sp. NPDC017941]|uniref:hypothetical protein n=1 Tax=Streptomyces sp. NPDC017941 TaxID=3365018 RepID=UPI0037AA3947
MEVPQVIVYAADLGGAPAAMRDSSKEFCLAIDFSRPPEEITASLTLLFQRNIDSRRWSRQKIGKSGEAE